MAHVSRLIISGSQQDFPVLDGDRIAGAVTRTGLLKALARRDDSAASEIMARDVPIGGAPDMLESALQRLQASGCHTLPVVYNQKLVGLLPRRTSASF